MKPVIIPVPQERRMQRVCRIDFNVGSPFGEDVAVLVSFESFNYVINNGTKGESMREAIEFAHILLELWDANPESSYPAHVALSPITAERAASISRAPRTHRPKEFVGGRDSDLGLIVNTCYEVIRNCPRADIRVEAARLLQRIGHVVSSGRLQ